MFSKKLKKNAEMENFIAGNYLWIISVICIFFKFYLMIDIAVIHICVPDMNVGIDVLAEKHVSLLLISNHIEITEEMKIPWPIACWNAAKSSSFLIMWLILSRKYTKTKHPMSDRNPNIPMHTIKILSIVMTTSLIFYHVERMKVE